MKIIVTLSSLFFLFFLSGCKQNKELLTASPDGRIKLTFSNYEIKGNNQVAGFSLQADNRIVLLPSAAEITSPGLSLEGMRVMNIEKESIRNSWRDDFGARKEIPDNYNSTRILLGNDRFRLIIHCRVYNEGVALAYEFPEQDGLDSLTITDESFVFRLPGDFTAWSAARAQAQYRKATVSTIDRGCDRPLLIEFDSSLTIALAEAKLVDFARMKFEPDTTKGIAIRSRLGSVVKKKVPFQSPWRAIMIGENPGDLLEKNYFLLNLNDPCKLNDLSWIKPGKAIRDVTLTTDGARALVDFIALHKMQYIEFDAGWYGPENDDLSDARKVDLDPKRSKGPLNLQEIIDYAHSKGIGVLLYVNRRALERQLDQLLPLYSKWGISGIKFGFVQVGTQPVTRWMHDAIIKAAEYKMIVDVHDEYRPTGFSRTWPNFLTQEGIRGDEESPSNSHTLITMFTRCIAGAADNTICYYDNRVDAKMGSHASQLAKAVCIFSPLQFIYWYDKTVPAGREDELEGKPNYLGNEPELEFFDNVPTTWDETKVLHGKTGEYGVIARRKGEEWFIGGINNDLPRTLTIDFSFLAPGVSYSASVYSDDPAVETRTHVKIERLTIDNKASFPAVLGSNKGFAIHIKPL